MEFADILSDCPPGTTVSTGVYHFSKTSNPLDHLHYWVSSNNPDLLKQASEHFASHGYDSQHYISYASRDHYVANHGDRAPLHVNVIEYAPAPAAAAAPPAPPPARSLPSSSTSTHSASTSPAVMISPMRQRPPPPPPPKGGVSTTATTTTTTTQPMATSPIATTFATPMTTAFPSPPRHQGGLFPTNLWGQQQQQQQPPQSDIIALVAQMMQQNTIAMQQLAASQQSMAQSTALKGPTTSFPKWDASTTPNNIAVYLELLRAYKADPFFAPVSNWAITLPASQVSAWDACTCTIVR